MNFNAMSESMVVLNTYCQWAAMIMFAVFLTGGVVVLSLVVCRAVVFLVRRA